MHITFFLFSFKEQNLSVNLASEFKRTETVAQLFEVPQPLSARKVVPGPLTLRPVRNRHQIPSLVTKGPDTGLLA